MSLLARRNDRESDISRSCLRSLLELLPVTEKEFFSYYKQLAYIDLEHARQEIGYEPQDNSLEKRHETKNTREGSALEEG